MAVSLERKRGDRWAKQRRAQGCWVQKLPSSSLAGLPDWLLVEPPPGPGCGIRVVEAKVRQERGSAFVPSQCTRAQRFFLGAVAKHGGDARVLVLGKSGYYEYQLPRRGALSRVSQAEYERCERPY